MTSVGRISDHHREALMLFNLVRRLSLLGQCGQAAVPQSISIFVWQFQPIG